MKQWFLTPMRRLAFACLTLAGLVCARPDAVHFLRWSDVQTLVSGFTSGADKLSEVQDASDWDNWIRERDASIRGRIDHGIEDSISELILFGSSFPAPPRLAAAAAAVNAAGDLTSNARARVDAFVQALDQLDTDRFHMALEFLRRRRVTEEELPAFLSGNLRRFALEEIEAPRNQARADVGISPETSLLINFAVDDTMRALKAAGALPSRVRRIAVIGPGLDLAGDPNVYDFFPPQSIQSFAVLEAALRLGCAQPGEVHLTALDMNPFVLSHLRTSLTKARAGQHYLLQLARPSSAGWNTAALSYFQRFGEVIGSQVPATAIAPPGLELRAIAVKPQIAARINVEDVNIVAQTLDTGAAQGFDLVVATNLFAYYSRVEQALALTSIARMMPSGGIFLANGIASAGKIPEFEDLGPRHVSYADNGAGGDDLLVYRRR